MIIDMPAITTTEVEAKLVDLKQSGNAVALGRVLTLVILNDEAIPVQGGAEVELDPSDLGAACCAMPEPGHVHDAVTGASVDGSSADNGSVDTASDGAGTGKRLLVRRARQGAGTPGHSAEGENANPDFAVHVDAEAAIHAANQASREHPARILALAGSPGAEPKLDAQVRIGGDAGASEVVLLNLSGPLRSHSEAVITPLLVPDAPIVAWWPNHAPAHPGEHPIGKVAKLRITDSNHCSNAREVLDRLAAGYRPGDSDLAWTRLTGWRAQIAAALDIAGSDPVTGVIVEAMPDRASAWLLAGWLAIELQCPTEYVPVPNAVGISSVTLQRASGDIVFSRPDGHTLSIKQPGFPERQIALPLTSLSEALTEELRRLDTDRVYEKVLTKGRALVSSPDTASPAAQEVAA